MINPYPEYKRDINFCKSIHKKYGKSFYFGTFLFDQSVHDATCVLYAFFRYPDEYVDTYFNNEPDVAEENIIEWRELWRNVYQGKIISSTPEIEQILRATKYVIDKYKIPYDYTERFLTSMLQDVSVKRYANYGDLENYMYGSASVVGLMMTYIVCNNDTRFQNDSSHREYVLGKAKAMGDAFQMTNFLRDIDADLKERNRIYIPQVDMQRFKVTEEMLQHRVVTPEFAELMKHEIDRTRSLYTDADHGLEHLPSRARVGVRVARVLYAKILDKIIEADYDVFTQRVHLSFIEKVWFAIINLYTHE